MQHDSGKQCYALVMITKRKLTVDDVFAMGEAGLITSDERVDLVEGELYTRFLAHP